MTIKTAADRCVTLFGGYLNGHPHGHLDDVQMQAIRFNLWTSNIGIFADSRASLDARLEHGRNTRYSNLIVQLLTSLKQNLLSMASRGLEEEAPCDNVQAITDITASLQRLSVTLRKSAAQNWNTKANSFIKRNDENQDVKNVVEECFGKIGRFSPRKLPKRFAGQLGAASLRRRRILCIRWHQENVSQAPSSGVAASIPGTMSIMLPESHAPRIINTRDPTAAQLSSIHNKQSSMPKSTFRGTEKSEETSFTKPDSDDGSNRAPSVISSTSAGSTLQDHKLDCPPHLKPSSGAGEAPALTVPQSYKKKRFIARDLGGFI